MSTEELDLMRDPFEELGHLRKLAKADPTKRFDMLYRLVCHPGVLAVAAERVRQNTGGRTAGIDGQTRKQINAELLTHLAEPTNCATRLWKSFSLSERAKDSQS